MTPATNNLYKTLGLLIMLKEQVRVSKEELSDEEKATLQISRQVLKDSELTIPELVASIKWLDEKGYTKGFIVFDEHLRTKANEELDNISEEQMNEILSALDTPEKADEIKKLLVEQYAPILPPGTEFDMGAVDAEEISVSEILTEGLSKYKELRADQVAVVLLLPFRSIDRLHKFIGEGVDPEDVKDEGVWYDSVNYEFHLGEEVVATAYQKKPNVEHYVLMLIADHLSEGVVWYDEVDHRSSRSIKDALLKFVAKNKDLESIFKVHSSRLEFDVEVFK
jgi:(2Fe-2S) ferredoxin